MSSTSKRTTQIALHSDVFLGARYDFIDPRCAFPLVQLRKKTRFGVLSLKSRFKRDKRQDGDDLGFVANSGVAIIVKATPDHDPLIIEFLVQQGMSDEEASTRLRVVEQWWGVVTGNHLHQALLELGLEDTYWLGNKWPVLVLDGNHDIDTLKQVARVNTLMQDKIIKSTDYDLIWNARKLYDTMSAERNSPPNLLSVSLAFDGVHDSDPLSTNNIEKSVTKRTGSRRNSNVTRSIRNSKSFAAVSVASKLDLRVIEEIGEIVNSEHPELFINEGNLSIEDLLKEIDCRFFQNFLSISALRYAKEFLDCIGESGIQDQIDTVHRCRFVFQQSQPNRVSSCSQRGVGTKAILEQLKMLRFARAEQRKFELFLETENWPIEMGSTKNKLLRTTSFDKLITANIGNEDKILPKLLCTYHELYPKTFHLKFAKFNHNMESLSPTIPEREETGAISKNPTGQNNTSLPTSHLQTDEGSLRNNVSNKDSDIPQPSSVTNSNERQALVDEHLRIKGSMLEDLDKHGIHALNLTHDVYLDSVYSETNDKIDLIFSDPGCLPSNATECNTIVQANLGADSTNGFVKFCKTVLVSGGYVLLYSKMADYGQWKISFQQHSFKWMEDPIILPYSNGSNSRGVYDFPSSNYDIILVARAPGKHPRSFEAPFNNNYEFLQGSRSLACPSFTSKFQPQLFKPNSRSPIRVDERNWKILREFIILFSPINGTVLDPFAGTMTLAMAATKCGRRSVVIEKDSTCFDISLKRLYNFFCNSQNSDSINPSSPKRVRSSPRLKAIQTKVDLNSTNPRSIEEYNGADINERNVKKLRTSDSTEVHNSSTSSEKGFKSLVSNSNIPNTQTKQPVTSQQLDTSSNSSSVKTIPLFEKGSKVRLIVDSKEVGTAELQLPSNDEENYRRSCHLRDLSALDDQDTFFVTIWKVEVNELFKDYSYPYKQFFTLYDGECWEEAALDPDKTVKLSSMGKFEFYVWNLFDMA